jgi:hypothetical protein
LVEEVVEEELVLVAVVAGLARGLLWDVVEEVMAVWIEVAGG